MKTILPEHIINRIMELVDEELTEKKVFFFREGTVISVSPPDLETLYSAQLNANKQLLSEGVLTMKMLEDDAKANGLM